MSGTSTQSHCPNCGEEMDTYCDWKPFDYFEHSCLHCGFQCWPEIGQMTLKELNAQRKDSGELKPLKKLPAFDKDKIW